MVLIYLQFYLADLAERPLFMLMRVGGNGCRSKSDIIVVQQMETGDEGPVAPRWGSPGPTKSKGIDDDPRSKFPAAALAGLGEEQHMGAKRSPMREGREPYLYRQFMERLR